MVRTPLLPEADAVGALSALRGGLPMLDGRPLRAVSLFWRSILNDGYRADYGSTEATPVGALSAQVRRPRPRSAMAGERRSAPFDGRDERPLWVSPRSTRVNISQLVAIAHSGVYSRLTCAPASIAANSACASVISGILGVGAKPSSAGARTARPSASRPVAR
jgi:hypothetical protein